MSCDVHDYEYIREHKNEYESTIVEANRAVQDALIKVFPNGNGFSPDKYADAVSVTFYKMLLDRGEMSVPVRCCACPFHRIEMNSIGMLCDSCDLNIDVYTGNMFFGMEETRPTWCPLNKEVSG
jgi:hypothetical protein